MRKRSRSKLKAMHRQKAQTHLKAKHLKQQATTEKVNPDEKKCSSYI